MPEFKVKLSQMVQEECYEYVEADTLAEAKVKAAKMLEDGEFELDWRDGDGSDGAVIEKVWLSE